MTTVARDPHFRASIDPEAARVGNTVRGYHTMSAAMLANAALLDHPSGRLHVEDLTDSGVYSVGYTPSPCARWLFIRCRVAPGTSVTSTAAVDLSLTDTLGNTVLSGTGEVPTGFQGEAVYTPLLIGDNRFNDATTRQGFIDLDAVRATLTADDWSLDFAVTITGSAEVQLLEAFEVPRFAIDDAAAHRGIIPSSFTPGRLVTNATPDGLQRLLATLDSGRSTIRHTYLSLAFAQSIATAPNATSAAGYTALTGLDEASTYETFKVLVRRLYAASAVGEPIKARVLYRFSGGTTETVKWRLNTGSSSSPFTSNNLAYTTSWTWSPWINGKLATNGTGGYDTLGLQAKLSTAGPTWYLAGVQVNANPS